MPPIERKGEKPRNPLDQARERFITTLHGAQYNPVTLRTSINALQDALMGARGKQLSPGAVFRELASVNGQASALARVRGDEAGSVSFASAQVSFIEAADALDVQPTATAPVPTSTQALPSMSSPKGA